MSKHRVLRRTWRGGYLKTFEHFFEDLEEAVNFANNSGAHSTKVYEGESGELVHSTSSTDQTSTYA